MFDISMQLKNTDATDDAAAGPITSIAGATFGHQEQDAVRITMDQPRDWHGRIFAARVGQVVWRSPGFFDPRNDLAPDRVVRVIARDQVKKVRGNCERELVARK